MFLSILCQDNGRGQQARTSGGLPPPMTPTRTAAAHRALAFSPHEAEFLQEQPTEVGELAAQEAGKDTYLTASAKGGVGNNWARDWSGHRAGITGSS